MWRGLVMAGLLTPAIGFAQPALGPLIFGTGSCGITAYGPLTTPEDFIDTALTITTNPDGSQSYQASCLNSDVFRFGSGLEQNFGAMASIHSIGEARPGVLRAYLRSIAIVGPDSYNVGAVGSNPYRAQSGGMFALSFTDTIVVPPSTKAPNAGDPTTIDLNVDMSCVETGLYPVQWYTDSAIGAGISSLDGTMQDGLTLRTQSTFSHAECPLYNIVPHVVSVTVGTSYLFTASLQLTLNQVYGTDWTIADLDAHTDSLSTALFDIRSADGNPIVGASGFVYDGTTGGTLPTITPTTSSTSTSTSVTTTTLASCAGTCGDSVMQPECGEACDCPSTADPIQAAFGCTGSDVIPSQDACALCRDCRLDLCVCIAQASTTSTIPGATTTTTVTGGSTTTTLPGSGCDPLSGIARARCLIEALLASPLCGADPIPTKVDRKLRAKITAADTLLGRAEGAEGPKQARFLRKAKAKLLMVRRKALALAPKRITEACAATIDAAIADILGPDTLPPTTTPARS